MAMSTSRRFSFFLVSLAAAAARLVASPYIEWSSAPTTAPSGQSYYIEAHGWDDYGVLSAVSVWREGSPYAFAGGGDGYDEWSGNPSTDTGNAYIDYEAESYNSWGYYSGVIYHTVQIYIRNQPTVSSSAATLAYGGSFSPSYSQQSGATSTGAWQFVVGGQTNWGGTQAGTLLYPGDTPSTSWTPPAAGTYGFWVRKLGDANFYESNIAGSYTITVNKINQPTVSSANATITYGSGSFSPSYNGGGGTGSWQWVVSGHTNWGTTSWTPPNAGSFTFHVRKLGDTNYNESNIAGSYTLTVAKLNQSSVGISPTSQTIVVNNSITFSASGGSGTGAYVWGGDASGTGSSKIVTFGTTGTRTVTVYRQSDLNYNNSNTATATITVNPKLNQATVSISPTSQTVTTGQGITFTASGGSGTGAYTWGGDATGTGSSKAVTFNTAGTRYVTVYRGGDSSYNNSNTAQATITVNAPASGPSITTQPQSQTINVGQTANFSVTVTGTSPFNYQWKKAGVDILGATGASYSISNAQTSHAGTYTVYITNSVGNTTSSPATLTVNAAPVITSQPQNQTVATGGAANFSVVATGTPTPTYQWRKNGVNLANGGNVSGATSSALALANVQSSDAATYTVYLSNSAGNVTSSGATLTVTTAQNDTTNQNQLNIHIP